MQAYEIGNLLLVESLKKITGWQKPLLLEGSKHGYYNEVSKMVLLEEFRIQVLIGHGLFGGCTGSKSEKNQHGFKRKWVFGPEQCTRSQVAQKDPHSSFVAIS